MSAEVEVVWISAEDVAAYMADRGEQAFADAAEYVRAVEQEGSAK